jgi:cobalt-zinc-cadmium efflux system outer membrane protein
MARTMLRTSSILVTELLGLEFEEPLTLRGELPIGTAAPSEISLVAHALRRRPDLSSVGHEVSVARSDVELAEAEAWPDVLAGFRYERDEGDDKYMAEVAIPLPIFNRNQGEVIRARGTLARLRAEEEALRLAVESDVRRAVVTYEQARQGTALYGAEVLDAQEESLDLLMRAFQAGEISYSEVVVVQRALIEGREGYLDTRLDFARARAQLIAATHLRQTETLEVSR